jgi:hypothetical protein
MPYNVVAMCSGPAFRGIHACPYNCSYGRMWDDGSDGESEHPFAATIVPYVTPKTYIGAYTGVW